MIGSIIALSLAGGNLPADPCEVVPITTRITAEQWIARNKKCREIENAQSLAEMRAYNANTRASNWFTFDECITLDQRVFKCENDRFYAVWIDDRLVVFVEDPARRIR